MAGANSILFFQSVGAGPHCNTVTGLQEQTIYVTNNANTETATGPVDGYVARRSATATKTSTSVNPV